MDNILNILLHINFLMPLFVLILMINPLAKSILVPEYLTASTFESFRIITVVIACCFRPLTFREELQF